MGRTLAEAVGGCLSGDMQLGGGGKGGGGKYRSSGPHGNRDSEEDIHSTWKQFRKEKSKFKCMRSRTEYSCNYNASSDSPSSFRTTPLIPHFEDLHTGDDGLA